MADPAERPTDVLNINWLVYQGLIRYGFERDAAEVREGVLGLARRYGFWEHYHPVTGQGHGAREFGWSAAVVLDLLLTESPHSR